MNDSIYCKVKKYINLPDKYVKVTNVDTFSTVDFKEKGKREIVVEKKRKIIEINSASVENYKSLRGIGDVLSVRIVKYRNLLGGFYSKKQLLEVYGLSEETYNSIKDYLIVDTTKIAHINLNFSEFRDFIFHPYLKKKDVKRIIDFRDSIGFITDENQLLEFSVLNDSVFGKISHYLEVKTPKNEHINKIDASKNS